MPTLIKREYEDDDGLDAENAHVKAEDGVKQEADVDEGNNDDDAVKKEDHGQPIKEETNDDNGDDDAVTKPPPEKKPRVSPERAQETADKIVAELAKNYSIGVREMPVDVLAPAVGYKNPRSDAIIAAMKILTGAAGLVSKVKNVVSLSDTGVAEYVEEEEVPPNAEMAMELFWSQLDFKLDSGSKTKNPTAKEGARNIWNLLQDGHAHSMQEVLSVTKYAMERSTGFPEIIKALKDLGLATKENKTLRFTDKVYPYGRPE
jgi:hypothetical protein